MLFVTDSWYSPFNLHLCNSLDSLNYNASLDIYLRGKSYGCESRRYPQDFEGSVSMPEIVLKDIVLTKE